MTNNTLAFISLCNEYCAAIENNQSVTLHEFIGAMLKILPRIYISATDLANAFSEGTGYIDSILDEESYNVTRRNLETLMGGEDTYLEVFEEDMKYSDTPIGASISENLADLFQVFYNFIETVKDSPDDVVEEAVEAINEDFGNYWGQILCNVMRPLNSVYYSMNGYDERL